MTSEIQTEGQLTLNEIGNAAAELWTPLHGLVEQIGCLEDYGLLTPELREYQNAIELVINTIEKLEQHANREVV